MTPAVPTRRSADLFRIIAGCAVEVGGALGPDRVQSIAGAVQRLALVGHRVDTLRAGLPDRVQRLGITLDRAAQAPGADRLRVMLALLLAGRVALGLGQCAAEVQPVEDAAPGFGDRKSVV